MRALLLAVLLLAGPGASHGASASTAFCGRETPLTARQQDRLLRFAAIVRRELENTGQAVALIARSGLNLHRFGVRYSHAGVSLKANPNGPWSVRQLYYACDERRPRLYDQGMAGFLFGTDDPATGYVSIVLLPAAPAAAVERVALDKAGALHLLAGRYSANAYAFGLQYQNCNQWVMELLATAWGAPAGAAPRRERAQHWLSEQGYVPHAIDVGSHPLMFAAGFIPWVHVDDHPREDLYALRFRISMPASIEAFVRQRLPGAERIELCHDEHQVVVHRGWEPVADGCRPGAGDRVIALD